MRQLPAITDDQFREILEHLSKNRNRSGQRRYGLERVARKSENISRASYKDPRLYFLLMKFARLHINIPFTTIDMIENKPISFKKEKAFTGQSVLVGFGRYTGYEVEQTPTEFFSILHQPLLLEDGELPQLQKEGQGYSCFLWFRTLANAEKSLSSYDAVMYNTEWCIAWYRDGLSTVFLSKKNGLPRPEKAKKLKSPTLSALVGTTASTAQELLFSMLESNSRDAEISS